MNHRLPRILTPTTRPLLAAVIAIGLLQAGFSVALTVGVAKAFALMTGTDQNSRSLWIVAAGAAVLAVVGFTIRTSERWLAEKFGQEYVHATRLKLWRKLETLPANSIAGERKGATVLRFIGDLSALKNWISRGLVGAIIAFLTITGGLVALTLLDLRLGAVALGTVLATLLFQAFWNRRVLTRVRALRKQRSRLATDIVERIQTLAVVQSANQARRERRRLKKKSRAVVDSAVHSAKASGVLLGLAEVSSLFLLTVILLVGAQLVAAGRLDGGGLVAALVLSRYLTTPIRRLSRVQEQWVKGAVSRRKLEQFLALDGLMQPAKPVGLKPGGGRLSIKKIILDGVVRPVSASAQPQDRVRLSGANGVGKSSLLRMVAGLEPVGSGKISLDGRNLARCTTSTISSSIALVSPDLPLMRGSLRRNLTYGNPRVSDAGIEEVLAQVALDNLIERLDRGLDTWINDGGSNLSLGEAARVRLARALLQEPRVLLLDEADTGLDRAGLRALRRVIGTFSGTVIFVWRGANPPSSTLRWKLTSKRLVTLCEAQPEPPQQQSSQIETIASIHRRRARLDHGSQS